MKWLKFILIVVVFSSCDYENPKQTRRVITPQEKKYSDKEIDSLISVNKDNVLFLDFYYGMDSLLYNKVEERLIENEIIDDNNIYILYYEEGKKTQEYNITPIFEDGKLIKLQLYQEFFNVINYEPPKELKEGHILVPLFGRPSPDPSWNNGLNGKERINELNTILNFFSRRFGNYKRDVYYKPNYNPRRVFGDVSFYSTSVIDGDKFLFSDGNRLISILCNEYEVTGTVKETPQLKLDGQKPREWYTSREYVWRNSDLRITFERGNIELYNQNQRRKIEEKKQNEKRVKDSISNTQLNKSKKSLKEM